MKKGEAKKRIEKLKDVINHHRYLYHVLDQEEISQEALDSLKKELSDLETQYPEFITPDSPTQRVAGQPLKEFSKVVHRDAQDRPARMNSLNDAFSIQDLKDWVDRLGRYLDSNEIGPFYADLKMDGLAIELVYQDHMLIQASTRGDGSVGEDVTQNIRTVDGVPLRLTSSAPRKIVVRGEIFLTKREFERINREQEKQGQKIYANPRNVAAGAVRQLDPQVTASRRLSFYAYGIVGNGPEYIGRYPTRETEYAALKKYGISVNPLGKVCQSVDDIASFYETIQTKRSGLAYEIDGLVVSINNLALYEKAGVIGKAPRGAVALKFAANEAETIIEDIIVQVGRTGTLTPVAKLRPVGIGGVTVSRATLHNYDEIRRLGVKIGDTVIVARAGDVIPAIVRVLPELRSGGERDFKMPRHCPVCGGLIQQVKGQVAYRCVNRDCPAIQRKAVYFMVSRSAFDIEGVGPKVIDALMEAALINDGADLFTLKKEDFLNLDRFADKSAENAVDAIQSRKKISLERFIYALGINHVGTETAFALAQRFKTIEALAKASYEELEAVADVGPIVARSIFDWFQKEYHQKLLKKFKAAGVRLEKAKTLAVDRRFIGKSFVLTGSLESLAREDAKDKIRTLGGDVSSAVSKATDYLVAGSEPGSKYDKAKELGVTILTEDEFLKMLK